MKFSIFFSVFKYLFIFYFKMKMFIFVPKSVFQINKFEDIIFAI